MLASQLYAGSGKASEGGPGNAACAESFMLCSLKPSSGVVLTSKGTWTE